MCSIVTLCIILSLRSNISIVILNESSLPILFRTYTALIAVEKWEIKIP